MKKLLLSLFLCVVTLFLVGCANTTSDEKILQQYDFCLGTIKERSNYIRNKTTGVLYSNVNSCIDYEYEETNIPIEKVEEEKEENK